MVNKVKVDTIIRVVKVRDIINLLSSSSSSSRTSTIKTNLLLLRLGINLVLPPDQVNLLHQDNLTSISPVHLLDPVNPTPDNTIKAATKTTTKVPIKDTINKVAKVIIRDIVRDTVRDSGVVATGLIPLDK